MPSVNLETGATASSPGTPALSPGAPRVVCVLGMHRSGTSLLTRVLNLLGVGLGPEGHLMPADKFNPKGFWEHHGIVNLNDEILETLGGTWRFLPKMPVGWENDARLEDVKARARQLVKREFGALNVWGWKDPRACVTLPFWRQVMPPMRYVMCFRNPLDCARSMEHTMSIETGVALWHRYVTEAIAQTADGARLWMFYEDFMEDWRGEMTRLADFVGLGEQARRPDALVSVVGFMDAELHHHRTRPQDVLSDARVSFAAKALYLAIRQRVNTDRTRAGVRPAPREREVLDVAIAVLSAQSIEAAPVSPQVHNGVEAPVGWTGD